MKGSCLIYEVMAREEGKTRKIDEAEDEQEARNLMSQYRATLGDNVTLFLKRAAA